MRDPLDSEIEQSNGILSEQSAYATKTERTEEENVLRKKLQAAINFKDVDNFANAQKQLAAVRSGTTTTRAGRKVQWKDGQSTAERVDGRDGKDRFSRAGPEAIEVKFMDPWKPNQGQLQYSHRDRGVCARVLAWDSDKQTYVDKLEIKEANPWDSDKETYVGKADKPRMFSEPIKKGYYVGCCYGKVFVKRYKLNNKTGEKAYESDAQDVANGYMFGPVVSGSNRKFKIKKILEL